MSYERYGIRMWGRGMMKENKEMESASFRTRDEGF